MRNVVALVLAVPAAWLLHGAIAEGLLLSSESLRRAGMGSLGEAVGWVAVAAFSQFGAGLISYAALVALCFLLLQRVVAWRMKQAEHEQPNP